MAGKLRGRRPADVRKLGVCKRGRGRRGRIGLILIRIAVFDIAVIKIFRKVSLKGFEVMKVEGRLQPETQGPTFRHTGVGEVSVAGQFFEEPFIFGGGEFLDGEQSVNEGLGQELWRAEKPGADLSVNGDVRNAIGNGDVFGG